MSKTVYYTRALKDGAYFDAMVVADDFITEYPITVIPVPASLRADGVVPRFSWESMTWEDASQDADAAANQKRDEDLAAAKQDAADAKAKVEAQAKTIEDLTTQLTEAQDAIVELAQETLPSTDDTTTATTTDTTKEAE